MANIFNIDNNLVEADELCRYLVKNGITDVELDSLASVVIKLGNDGEMSFNTLNKIITIVQEANTELKNSYECGCFNIELDFLNNQILITETCYE